MANNAIVRWRRAHPAGWHLVSIVSGAACFVLLWFLGAGSIALACGVVFVLAEAPGLGSVLLRQRRQRSERRL